MRLRSLLVLGLLIAFIGAGIWVYRQGSVHQTYGSIGLPLIKADANPVKMPPDDAGGEVMPNAESTVFSAMGNGAASDPSMDNLKLPSEKTENQTSDTSEFAGLRTGFALPAAPERKTESLFGQTPTRQDEGQSKYFSGIAPEAVTEKKETPPEPVQEPVQPIAQIEKSEPVQETAPAPKSQPEPAIEKEPEPEPEPLPAAEELPLPESDGDIAAQNLEAQEMAAIRPSIKPAVPSVPEEPKPDVEKEKAEDAPYVPAKPASVTAQPIAPPTQPTPKAIALPSPGKGNYYIQLASAVAGGNAGQDTWRRLKNKYPEALSDITPAFVPATVPGKGEYVRIQAGPFTNEQAKERCEAIRLVDPKGGCLVLRR